VAVIVAVLPIVVRTVEHAGGDRLTSESDFWNHATAVHGTPPLGLRRVTGKRKTPDSDNDETWV
jgi:hypothetical protein